MAANQKTAVAAPPKRKAARKRRLQLSRKEQEPVSTVLEAAEEFRRSIPAEAWGQLPSDGSIYLDHYLYGVPKKDLEG